MVNEDSVLKKIKVPDLVTDLVGYTVTANGYIHFLILRLLVEKRLSVCFCYARESERKIGTKVFLEHY